MPFKRNLGKGPRNILEGVHLVPNAQEDVGVHNCHRRQSPPNQHQNLWNRMGKCGNRPLHVLWTLKGCMWTLPEWYGPR